METSVVVAKVKNGRRGKGGEDGLSEGKGEPCGHGCSASHPYQHQYPGYNTVPQFYKMLPFENWVKGAQTPVLFVNLKL